MIDRRMLAVALSAILAACQGMADDQKANILFSAKADGSDHSPRVIGSYARGCLAGGVQLPETGPTWQAMRLSRNRNWGHPILVDYIIRLSRTAADLGWNGLYVGDLTQPRGGPMRSGHRSHQSGLDADIWMRPPGRLDLTIEERETFAAMSVRTDDQLSVNENWTQTHMELLKAAASDPLVDRIFVAAAVKLELCAKAGQDRDWLQRIRPLYGHNYHFHVRLKCPPGNGDCVTQTPTVAELSDHGDGCDASLEWWVTDYLEALKNPPKDPPPPRRSVRDYVMADLPQACQTVLTSN